MEPPILPQPSRLAMSRSKRILIGLILGGSVLSVGLVLLLIGIFIYSMRDIKPLDDSVYLPKFTSLDNSNPLASYQDWVSTHPVELVWDPKKSFSSMTNIERDEAHSVILKHQSDLLRFEELQASNTERWRLRDADKQARMDADCGYLKSIQACANLTSYRARLALLDGNAEEALKQGLQHIRTGQGLARSQGSLINFLVSISVQAMGQRLVSDALNAKPELAKDPSLSQMPSYEVTSHDFSFAMRFEYLGFKNLMNDLTNGKWSYSSPSPEELRKMKLIVCPNKSFAHYLDIQGPVILALDKDWSAALGASKLADAKVKGLKANIFLIIARGNVIGDIMMNLMLPAYEGITRRGASMSALNKLTQCQAAILSYRLDHKKYPDSLDELVPMYLSEVPTDPFSGKPMRWSLQKGRVYSIGVNGKDDGGIIDLENAKKGLDLGIQLPAF